MDNKAWNYLFSLNVDHSHCPPKTDVRFENHFEFSKVKSIFQNFLKPSIEKRALIEYYEFDFSSIKWDKKDYIQSRVAEMWNIVKKNYIRFAVFNSLDVDTYMQKDPLYIYLNNKKRN